MATEALVKYDLGAKSEEIHWEHEQLMEALVELDSALAEVDFDSQPVPKLESINDARRIVCDLLAELPLHFANEEATVLSAIASVNPSLSAFSSEMVRQHHEIWKSLSLVAAELRDLRSSTDLAEDLARVQVHIEELCRTLVAHMKSEERMYAVLEEHKPELACA
jgi:hypothetical protein